MRKLNIERLESKEMLTGMADAEKFGPEDNWGYLTSSSIQDGFEQGPHSADPSGDGHGPGTADEPRDGLANVVEDGNLRATHDFIKGLLS